jgi:hypothetical protein
MRTTCLASATKLRMTANTPDNAPYARESGEWGDVTLLPPNKPEMVSLWYHPWSWE